MLLLSCDMARKRGDLEHAERLLALCDARSMFVELDSDYRTTAAMLALARWRNARALELVGARDGEVPFCASAIYQACMTRTAALEALGRHGEAERALAFNREQLGDEIIDDWLDGSQLLAPAHAVWRRLATRSDATPIPEIDEASDLFADVDDDEPAVITALAQRPMPELAAPYRGSPLAAPTVAPQSQPVRRSYNALSFALISIAAAIATALLLAL